MYHSTAGLLYTIAANQYSSASGNALASNQAAHAVDHEETSARTSCAFLSALQLGTLCSGGSGRLAIHLQFNRPRCAAITL